MNILKTSLAALTLYLGACAGNVHYLKAPGSREVPANLPDDITITLQVNDSTAVPLGSNPITNIELKYPLRKSIENGNCIPVLKPSKDQNIIYTLTCKSNGKDEDISYRVKQKQGWGSLEPQEALLDLRMPLDPFTPDSARTSDTCTEVHYDFPQPAQYKPRLIGKKLVAKCSKLFKQDQTTAAPSQPNPL